MVLTYNYYTIQISVYIVLLNEKLYNKLSSPKIRNASSSTLKAFLIKQQPASTIAGCTSFTYQLKQKLLSF